MLNDMLGSPALYVVRHGETELNAGNDYRGFSDVPLDDNGKQQAKELREFLKDVPLTAVHSSDLKRAHETASTIRRELQGMRDAAARPWNIGIFAGKPKNDVNRRALQSYADTPDIPIPKGESLNEFRARFGEYFNRLIQEALDNSGPVLLVAHASNIHEVGHIIAGDIEAYDVDPGGVVAVYVARAGLSARVIKGQASEDEKGVGKS